MHWLCQCLCPQEVIHDNGGEFIGKEFQELLYSYSIKDVPVMVKNPQANSTVERMHLTIRDMFQMTVFEGDNWWVEMEYTLKAIVR
eukprot:14931077-Ditylum_brightwellii.AAC.3